MVREESYRRWTWMSAESSEFFLFGSNRKMEDIAENFRPKKKKKPVRSWCRWYGNLEGHPPCPWVGTYFSGAQRASSTSSAPQALAQVVAFLTPPRAGPPAHPSERAQVPSQGQLLCCVSSCKRVPFPESLCPMDMHGLILFTDI